MLRNRWGTKEWFESQFNHAQVDTLGDGWGHRWRGSQKFRYSLCLNMLKPVLTQNGSMNVLDIGCALGDFTIQAWKLNPKNQFKGIDISANAIARVSQIYPHIQFKVSALPEIPFKERSFDCIICLEVLYYLVPKDRLQAVENIYHALCRDGMVLFSSVLDGGRRYFSEDGIIELISDYFDIQKIQYNYAKLYTEFEKRLMMIRNLWLMVKSIIEMSDSEYQQWQNDKKQRLKLKVVDCFRKIVSIIPFGRRIICYSLNLAMKFVMSMLGWKILPAWFQQITKVFLRKRGQSQIIILAKKK